MTRAELLASASQIFNECLEIMEKKNKDYSRDNDALSNFKRHGSHGIVVRMDDKYERIDNLDRKGTHAVEESMTETLMDMINYCNLCIIKRREKES